MSPSATQSGRKQVLDSWFFFVSSSFIIITGHLSSRVRYFSGKVIILKFNFKPSFQRRRRYSYRELPINCSNNGYRMTRHRSIYVALQAAMSADSSVQNRTKSQDAGSQRATERCVCLPQQSHWYQIILRVDRRDRMSESCSYVALHCTGCGQTRVMSNVRPTICTTTSRLLCTQAHKLQMK